MTIEVENLERIRNILVGFRRTQSANAIDHSGAEQMLDSQWLNMLLDTQAQIEVLDRMIADEKTLSPSFYESSGLETM